MLQQITVTTYTLTEIATIDNYNIKFYLKQVYPYNVKSCLKQVYPYKVRFYLQVLIRLNMTYHWKAYWRGALMPLIVSTLENELLGFH